MISCSSHSSDGSMPIVSFARAGAEIEIMQRQEAAQLLHRLRGVVDPQIDEHIVGAEIAALMPCHIERRRLATAAIPAGGVAGLERREQPVGKRAGPGGERRGHGGGRLRSVRIALAGEAGAGLLASPGVAGGAGVRGGAAAGVDQPDLPLVAAVVGGDQTLERLRRPTSPHA
jgi:hypothetical protein